MIRDRFRLSEPVLVMNSDIITKLNFEDFYQSHLREASALTVGIREHEYIVPYGVVQIEGKGICSVEERPKLSFNISCGIYVVSPDVFNLVPKDQLFDMPDLIRVAVKSGYKTFPYQIREQWVAIESLADLTEEASMNE